jgi:hypothetical protein
MPTRRLRPVVLGAAVAGLLVLGSGEARVAVAYVAPFLALLSLLLADRYPGERLIRGSRSPAPKRRGPVSVPALGFAEPRARRAPLLAFALAGRAPPFRSGRSVLF